MKIVQTFPHRIESSTRQHTISANRGYLPTQLQDTKQQSSEFQINRSDSSRLAHDRDFAHQDTQMLRQKYDDGKRPSYRWRDASLKSEKDGLHPQTILQDFISEQEAEILIPSRTDETVPIAWVEVSNQPQCSHAGRNFFNDVGSNHLLEHETLG